MTAYHSKPLAMTLRKLTLSISLLAASLILTAPLHGQKHRPLLDKPCRICIAESNNEHEYFL